MKNILISGSLAYDSIMDFPGRFKDHILPDQIHILNVCFLVDDISKNYGGCAGNIAYTMKLFGANPIILSVLGKDGREYYNYLRTHGISTKYIAEHESRLTSYASILTDKDDNQITAYHNGASDHAGDLRIEDVSEEYGLGMVVPTLREAMITHARSFASKKIPFVFDPGQQLPGFSGKELEELLPRCSFYIVNDYEMRLTEKITGHTQEELSKTIKTLIITRGAQGSQVFSNHGAEMMEVRASAPRQIVDPTGAGDAYRAGFFWAYAQKKDLTTCARTGSVSAAYAIEQYGTQNHCFSLEEFERRYQETYQ
ncbi:carbohydrate kinase family protein [Candidatus Uhrbacteria bacterium]|nr:carbohydrate kinase family protein [Candidatus Uhrbacteria bacterium]